MSLWWPGSLCFCISLSRYYLLVAPQLFLFITHQKRMDFETISFLFHSQSPYTICRLDPFKTLFRVSITFIYLHPQVPCIQQHLPFKVMQIQLSKKDLTIKHTVINSIPRTNDNNINNGNISSIKKASIHYRKQTATSTHSCRAHSQAG